LRQFENDKNMASVENEARRCVILAIKSGNVINFEELLELKTIKALEAVSKLPFLSNIFRNIRMSSNS
jgi:hypothetical protein